jgi:flavorubredoxin
MNKVKIADKAYWIGKVDNRKVPFHRLILEKGTTYNSYLLETEKPTLIDTVDILFAGEFLKDLAQIMDLSQLRYVIVNHVEPDHAGAVGALMGKAKNAVIVTTEKGKEFLIGMFNISSERFYVVKDKETLDIGGKTLMFLETPFLHTEETMITYCVEDKILYPCDQFSTHIATNELFNDLSSEDITEDFKGYYQLILHPHRPYVRDMLDKIKNLSIEMIAPSHGYILRSNVQGYIKYYDEMSTVKKTNPKKALILVSSMTGRTTKIGDYLAQGLHSYGIEASVLTIKNHPLNEIMALVEEADAILVGSSTRYGDMIGNLEDVLIELKKLDLSKKIGAAFGSYGWSGEGIEIVNDYLKASTINLVDSSFLIKAIGSDHISFPLRIQFTPSGEAVSHCEQAGRILGEILLG